MTPITTGELIFMTLLGALLLLSAVIDYLLLKVPNWLTFSMILSGWIYGACFVAAPSAGVEPVNRFVASLLLTGLGFLLLFPVYAVGGMGGGDVKMQMGYGAWVGAHYGLVWEFPDGQPGGVSYLVYGFCIAAIVGGVIALGMMAWRGDFAQNRQNVADILRDLMNPTKAPAAAAARKPRMHLLPYGVPLCIGYISYIVFSHLA